MKRIAYLCLGGLLVACLMTARAGAQSLGDSARAARKQKPQQSAPKKVYDNDNLPRTEHISTVGPTQSAEAATADAASQPTPESATATPVAGSAPKPEAAPEGGEKDRQKQYDSWQKKIADQKDKIALAERELDVMQREYRLRAAAMYADVGNRLRNQTQWDKDDATYKTQVEQKKKEVDAAKQALTDLQEQARKAGVPARLRE